MDCQPMATEEYTGIRSVMSGPLGRRTAFTLMVNGPWTGTAARNLIRQLELQVEWLEADTTPKSAISVSEGSR